MSMVLLPVKRIRHELHDQVKETIVLNFLKEMINQTDDVRVVQLFDDIQFPIAEESEAIVFCLLYKRSSPLIRNA